GSILFVSLVLLLATSFTSPLRPPPCSLFPYTTLFRSSRVGSLTARRLSLSGVFSIPQRGHGARAHRSIRPAPCPRNPGPARVHRSRAFRLHTRHARPRPPPRSASSSMDNPRRCT